MAYVRTIWKNREVERPRTFEKIENTDGTITLLPSEGTIIEEGTPIIAETMNNIEDGIEAAHNAIDEHKADNFHHIPYAVATGTNSYAVNIQGITALTEGMSIKVRFQNANTGTATLNINGLGAKAIKKSNGNDLASGNIKAGQILHLVYTGSVFQSLGEGGEYGNVTPDDVIKGVTFGTEEGLKTGTLELTGNAVAADVLNGKTFYSTNPKSKLTGSMTNRGAVSQTLTTQGGSYTIPAGYHNGSGKVTANFANLIASNIRSGVNVGGVVGTFKGGWNVTSGSLYGADDRGRVIKTISGYQDDTGTVGFRVDVPGITSSSTVHAVLISRVFVDNITESDYGTGPWHWSNAIYRGPGSLPSVSVSGIVVYMNSVAPRSGYIDIYYDWRIRYRDGRLSAEITMYENDEYPILVIWS